MVEKKCMDAIWCNLYTPRIHALRNRPINEELHIWNLGTVVEAEILEGLFCGKTTRVEGSGLCRCCIRWNAIKSVAELNKIVG